MKSDLLAHPPEDVGADTQARFRYQSTLAAKFILDSLLDGSSVHSVICEWWEDYVVVWHDDVRELVSVKHLEPGQARWTLQGLCHDGGLRHLFDRWRKTGHRCRARLQTNSGMKPGQWNPDGLREALRSADSEVLSKWAIKLVPLLMPEEDASNHVSVDEVATFLSALTIDHRQPDREHVEASVAASAGADVCRELSVPAENAATVVAHAIDLVQRASSVTRHEVIGKLLANTPALDTDSEALGIIAAKTVDSRRIRQELRDRLLGQSGVPRIIDEPVEPTRLVRKLQHGGFRPNAVEHARQLRLNWLQLGHRFADEAGQPPMIVAELEFAALGLVRQAEEQLRVTDEPYGRELSRIVDDAIGEWLEANQGLMHSRENIMGAVYSLTERCKIWWSDRFDVGAL